MYLATFPKVETKLLISTRKEISILVSTLLDTSSLGDEADSTSSGSGSRPRRPLRRLSHPLLPLLLSPALPQTTPFSSSSSSWFRLLLLHVGGVTEDLVSVQPLHPRELHRTCSSLLQSRSSRQASRFALLYWAGESQDRSLRSGY